MTVQEAIIEYIAETYTGGNRMTSYDLFIGGSRKPSKSHDVGDVRFFIEDNNILVTHRNSYARCRIEYADPELFNIIDYYCNNSPCYWTL